MGGNRGPKCFMQELAQVSFNYWYLKYQLESESLSEVSVGILNTNTHFYNHFSKPLHDPWRE